MKCEYIDAEGNSLEWYEDPRREARTTEDDALAFLDATFPQFAQRLRDEAPWGLNKFRAICHSSPDLPELDEAEVLGLWRFVTAGTMQAAPPRKLVGYQPKPSLWTRLKATLRRLLTRRTMR